MKIIRALLVGACLLYTQLTFAQEQVPRSFGEGLGVRSANRYFNNFETNDTLPEWINMNTKQEGQAHSGNYFSKTNGAKPYSAGIELEFPFDLKRKNFRVSIRASIHIGDTNQKIILVTSISSKDSLISWKGLNVAQKFGKANEWVTVYDSILIPANLPVDSKLKIFFWNEDGRAEAGVDDVEIALTEISLPSFIPQVNSPEVHSSAEKIFRNKFYTFKIDTLNGAMHIESAEGKKILDGWNYFSELIRNNSTDTITVDKIKFVSFREGILKFDAPYSLITLYVSIRPDNPKIRFTFVEDYSEKVKVIRSTLFFNFSVPVTEVYRKNRQADDTLFQNEYWLDKEGVKFGRVENCAIIYHTPDVSSLQLNTKTNQLIVNLDYNQDHPFLRFPLLDSAENKKIDLSCSEYNSGDVRKNSFSIFVGQDMTVPRLMLNPYGYLSTYVFTEHADWGDMRTHRATYFGSEEITDANNATGGFIKNKIPVTKSVFYSNPDNILNSQSTHESISQSPITNIKTTDGFEDFLKQLYKRGYDICLHTPDQFTSKRPLLQEAIAYMKKNFNAVSWIDHGYDNGAKNNREDFVCDGLDSTSQSYAKDLWEKYGTKYFWNTYNEDYSTADSGFVFNSSLMKPYIGFGDCFPTPNYCQHPNAGNKFYEWSTRDLLEMPAANSWNYQFSKERLNDFVNNGAVSFAHCYPAGSIVNKGFWKLNDEKKIVIEPEFEKTLQRLATYRDSGLIHLTTVRDIMNYWTDCEKIKFDYLPDGKIKITNTNDHAMKGLSLAVKANKVLVDGKIPSSKKRGSDFIFWFDIKAGQNKIIEAK